METLLETTISKSILNRVNMLTPTSHRRWGKMDVAQMMAHCAGAVAMASGEKAIPRVFIGRILGPILKKRVLDESVIQEGMPTVKELAVTEPKIFNLEKQRLIDAITRFNKAGRDNIVKHKHPFFGMMTTEEWGRSAYKHLDHHLKQFGA